MITTNNGGITQFMNTSTGGNAHFITTAGGIFDISTLTSGGMTAGSIEGAGTYSLGSKTLTVGGNNLSTSVSGQIADGGSNGGTGGSLVKVGTGTLTLTGTNTYSGGTSINAGVLNVGADNNLGAASGGLTFNGGMLQFGASFNLANTRAITLSGGGGTLDTNGFNTLISQGINGTGGLNKISAGTLTLSGTNTYNGNTNVNAGTLLVNGSVGGGSVNVASGASLGGTGTIAGPVNIQNGGILAPGASPGTLTMGTLTLNSGSVLNYQLGTPNVVGNGVNDLVTVNGNLTLAGTLNVTNVGGFGQGVYRLFNYTGTLTNNGLNFGTMPLPAADFLLQTSQANQINLIVSNSGFTNQFWDGATTTADGIIHGGSGTWNNVATNWTNLGATANAPWNKGFAIFEGTAGTVNLGDNINFGGVQFMTDGYIIAAPGAQTLIAATGTIIRVDPGVTATIAAPIVDGTGTADVTKTDLGTLILTGTNTYTGGTTISTGTLQLGNGGGTGSIVGNVIDNGIFAINRSDIFTFGGLISGIGSFEQRGAAGTTIFTGANTYTGGTTILRGILQLGNGSATGSIVGNVVNNGTFNIFNANTSGITTITNNGGLTEFRNASTAGKATINNINGGQTQFFNASTAGNATITISGGSSGFSAFFNTSTAGNATITINKSAFMVFQNSSTAGNATITNSNFGFTEFLDTSTASNAKITNTSDGGTDFAGTGTAGNATITTNTGGATSFFNTSTAGNATITNNTGGVTNFFNTSTADHATITANNGGFTRFFNTSTAGNATITTNAGGYMLFIDKSTGGNARFITNAGGIFDISALTSGGMTAGSIEGAGTYHLGSKSLTVGSNNLSTAVGGIIADGGIFGGTEGSLVKVGTGTLTLTGTNTYSGGTSINAGALNVSADSNLGAASGGLTFNGGTLQFGSAFNLANTRTITLNGGGGTFDTNGFNTSVSQGITGIGGLTKTGPGTLTLSGSGSYSGGTVLNAGILLVDNAQALGLGNVTVNAGIVEADPQPINVKGNYTQNAGGTLLLQVAGAGSGQYDFLNVSGNANLGGTLQLTNLGYKPKAGDQLTLVTAGGSVTSRFARWVDPFTTGPGINTIDLIYSKNSVTLEFLNLITPPVPPVPPVGPTPPPVVITTIDFASFALTPNQRAAGNLLDDVQLDSRASNLMSFLYKEPFANLPSDFDKISPESLTAFYEISFSGANIQRLNLENRLEDIRNDSDYASGTRATVYLEDKADGKSSKNPPMLPPVREKRWDFWATSFGDFVHVDSDFNARGYKFTTGGIDLGIDYRLTDHLAFGLMGNYAHTWSDLRPGSIDVDSGRGGLYATYFDRCFYLNAGIYGGYNSYDSSRRGLQGNASGNSDGAEFSTFVSGGYDFHLGHLTVGPIASLQYTNVYVDSFMEKGSLAPLSIHSDSEESLRSDVGFRASYQWQVGTVQVEPFLKATWEHEFKYSTLPITASFANIPGPSATFLGPSEGHDSAVVDAGISAQWTPCISTYVSYNGLLGRDRYDSNGVSGGIRIRF
jgi:outer membrane autotransporter protein